MKRRMSSFVCLAVLLAAFCVVMPARSAATTNTVAYSAVQAKPTPGSDQEGPKGVRSDEDQFRQSPSVQVVARMTGLSMDNAYWLSVVINFAVIAIVIFWALKKNLPSLFRNRTAAIQKAMQEARAASDDANRRLGEVEARLSKFDAEIAQMRAAAEKDLSAEEQAIKAAAEEDARKIVEAAEQEIAAAAKTARRELTAYVADLAVTLARKQIHVDANTDQALLGNFAQQLSAEKGNGAK